MCFFDDDYEEDYYEENVNNKFEGFEMDEDYQDEAEDVYEEDFTDHNYNSENNDCIKQNEEFNIEDIAFAFGFVETQLEGETEEKKRMRRRKMDKY